MNKYFAKHAMMLRIIVTCLLLFQVVAATPAFAEETTEETLLSLHVDKLLADLEKDPNGKGLLAGIQIYNLSSNEQLYAHNEHTRFVPASNMKLFTIATALDRLGPDYRYKTEIYVDGPISEDGSLQGNLILKGYGDPSFTSEDLEELAEELMDRGIRHIQGSILVDESYFDEMRLAPGWMWDDEPYDYSAQISALGLDRNIVTIEIKPDNRVGEAPNIQLIPENSYLSVSNSATTVSGTSNNTQVNRPRAKNLITVKGTIGENAKTVKETITMEDPALYVGNVFSHYLAENGITINDPLQIQKTTVDSDDPFLTHHSEPLRELITYANKESDNFYLEMLCKTLGAVEGRQGSFEEGAKVIAEYLEDAGIEGYQQVDGSGLSRHDLISAADMVALLRYVESQEYWDEFVDSLPIAGVDGTLANRMKNTPAANNLKAKTGSMSGVNALSGTVTAENGDTLLFSILTNGVYKSASARKLQDDIGVLLAKYPNLSELNLEEPAEEEPDPLSEVLDPIWEEIEEKGMFAGIAVRAINPDGEDTVLYERNGDKLLTPASNMKLFTMATALRELGNDYRFKTEIYLSAPIRRGVVDGDVIIKGYGDPTLHTDDRSSVMDGPEMEELVKILEKKGVEQINGNIIVDDSYFDDNRLPLGWTWDNESYGYSAQVSALSLNRGSLRLYYSPGNKAGDPVELELVPQTDYVQIINEAQTVDRDDRNTLSIERQRGKNVIIVKGNLPRGTDKDYERLSVEEPALYTGTVLKETLLKKGVKLAETSTVIQGQVPHDSDKIGTVYSQKLSEIVEYGLKNSDNHFTEMLLKTLGAVKGDEGSSEAGVSVVQKTMKDLDVNTDFDMVDGSGLTRYNIVSVNHVTSLLSALSKQPRKFELFYDALPIAGKDGTLKDRMKKTEAEDNVHAKTGSLAEVSSLSGYVTTKDGQELCFSILMNNYPGKAKDMTDLQDQIAIALAELELDELTE
ncbi:D-alanyl-D-alanine carboxypeptidase/D-alanyl-D-alanine endopeptidase [Brevibacillus migulae]|uniref:D-alanyl-D-alanine carboxypeptidase/D-alanyl-D-alanine endopeptidase n=1 Tax=Brevibacillus migulae TaxID=1644114 RepID=UPI00106EB5FA|nr:D-alanyl-D-alanine carboxypeptidase/D-alanyl-D-alanine-endopeptidase [Brevibacillus migulae]